MWSLHKLYKSYVTLLDKGGRKFSLKFPVLWEFCSLIAVLFFFFLSFTLMIPEKKMEILDGNYLPLQVKRWKCTNALFFCFLQRLHSCPDLVSFMVELKTILVSDRTCMWEKGCCHSFRFYYDFFFQFTI